MRLGRSPGRCAAVPLRCAARRCADSAGLFPARAPSAWLAHGRNGATHPGEEFHPSDRIHLQPRGSDTTGNVQKEGERRERRREARQETQVVCVCV